MSQRITAHMTDSDTNYSAMDAIGSLSSLLSDIVISHFSSSESFVERASSMSSRNISDILSESSHTVSGIQQAVETLLGSGMGETLGL